METTTQTETQILTTEEAAQATGFKNPKNGDYYQRYNLNRSRVVAIGTPLVELLEAYDENSLDAEVREAMELTLSRLGYLKTERGGFLFPDPWAVTLRETSSWELDVFGADEKYILDIENVYVFDRSARTHVCEATPSYFLRHVENRATFAVDTPDDAKDRVDAIVQESNRGMDTNTYAHCHEIDAILEKGKPFRSVRLGGGELICLDDVVGGYEGYMQAIVEGCSANSVL